MCQIPLLPLSNILSDMSRVPIYIPKTIIS